MKIAIPLRRQNDYTELMYSLRSIERFVEEPEVLIIGEELPRWINNVTWLKVKDMDGRKQLSVKRKILAALEVSEEILFTNDDIFWLKENPVPYYHNGDLKGYSYTGSKELQKELKAMGKPTKSFELHMPIIFRQDFKEIIKRFSGDTLIRSAYANFLEIEGEQTIDCKFVKAPTIQAVQSAIDTRPFISTGIYSIKAVLPVLQKLFPTKSQFEI